MTEEEAVQIAEWNGWEVGVDKDNGGAYLVLLKDDRKNLLFRDWVNAPFAENFRRNVLESLAKDVWLCAKAYDTLVDFEQETGDFVLTDGQRIDIDFLSSD